MRRSSGLMAIGVWFLLAPPLPAWGKDPATSAPKNLAELDARLAASFTEAGIPGATVAIVENGEVVLAKGYGFADVAAKKPATADSVFRAGSISKSLTGIAVMTLVEQGKLSLDARLAELAPEVKFQNPWEATDPVRLVHLLEHTTGWPDISLRVLLLDGKGWSLLRGVQNASPDFVCRWKPGLHPVYNNAAPAVAGVILAKAAGQDFDGYLRDRVLRPMGMATADFSLPADLAARMAKSYDPDGKETYYQTITLAPAGSLATSARELAQLVRFFLGRGTVDGRQVLSPASVERIERSESSMAGRAGLTNGYGLGNAPLFDRGPTFRGHNGGIDSFTSVYGYSLRNNSGYVLMANGGKGVDFAMPLSHLVEAYLTRGLPPIAVPVAPAGATGENPALERFAGLYRPITYPNALIRPFQEILGLSRVSARGGKLISGGHEFTPVGDHGFQRADRDQPSLAFVEDGGETYKLSALGSARKEPLWGALLIVTTLGLIVLGLLISIVMLPVWLIAK
ncbi:MAG TPA: serine hydrolase domain-containing protein, partial [Thermoanaerobaculia bacterium]|nr:serine hydrolase domain-containing protein [Thermoanaerobaculia bacterium]